MSVTAAATFLALFTLCSPGHGCEEGEVRARSCAAAEAAIRDLLRPGMTLISFRCDPVP